MKHLITAILLCLCALLLTGCDDLIEPSDPTPSDTAEESKPPLFDFIPTEPAPTITAEGTGHTHVFEDDHYCTSCNAMVQKNRDGSFSVTEWDTDTRIEYDADGKVTARIYWVTNYYENGDVRLVSYYRNGMLTEEHHYEIHEETEHSTIYVKKEILYGEDGGQTVRYYHPLHDYVTVAEHYDGAGNLTMTERFECEVNGKGRVMKRVCYRDGVLYCVEEYFSDPNTYRHQESEILYAPDGSIEEEYAFTYAYNSLDQVTRMTVTRNGALHLEAYYTCDAKGRYYCYREVTYTSDGKVEKDTYLDLYGAEIRD